MLTEITNSCIKNLDHCDKCGNRILSDESYYEENMKPIVVIACHMCGKRWYPNDHEIDKMIKEWRNIEQL